MTNLRLWVGVLALTAFLAGLACAPFVSSWLLPARTASDATPFPDYERMLVDTFHLGPERREPLRALLAEYRMEIERIKDRHMADYMSAMEPDLREKGLRYRDLIRNKVLPEPLRPEFDRLCLGPPATQAPH